MYITNKIFLLLCCCCFSVTQAQPLMYYAASKTGLSLREQSSFTSKVLQKIDYGQKVEIIKDTATPVKISTEGFNGVWQKIKYNNSVGYVVSSYLFVAPPPKPNIKTLKDYLAQLSTVAGPTLVVVSGNKQNRIDNNYYELKKQLYKNGAEWHHVNWYESNSETYFIPNFSIEQAFLLVRLIGQFETEVGSKDEFPNKNTSIKLQYSNKKITVEKDKWDDGTEGPISKIIIETEEGGSSSLEIFLLDGEAVISWSWGA